jgi:hypothetical protein
VLVGEQVTAAGGYGIADASLVDGSVTPVAHFSYARGCELVGRCEVWRIQLATNLLADAGIRDTLYPDRGPFVLVVDSGLIGLPVLLVGWLAVIVARRIRMRREAMRTPPDSPADREHAMVAS